MAIIHYEICDIGLERDTNQDSILAKFDRDKNYGLFVVADGMGGHKDGDYASNAITSRLGAWWDKFDPREYNFEFKRMITAIQNNILETNQDIYDKYSNSGICGSTCIVLFIYEGQYAIVSAGDSHIYRKRGRVIESVMIDDVWENQSDVRSRLTKLQIAYSPNKGKLVNAIGAIKDPSLSVVTDELKADDTFLLCSDGLYKYCPMKFIKKIMKKTNVDVIADNVNSLLDETYKHRAKDNISIILVKNE